MINCRVELKLKWTKYSALSAAGIDNTDADPNNIILLSKAQNYLFLK